MLTERRPRSKRPPRLQRVCSNKRGFLWLPGLATDVEGARAAVALAEKLRGAYDHMQSEFLLRDIDVMRQAGQFVTTPNEARVRADCVVLIGAKLTSAWPDMLARLDLSSPARFDDFHEPRKILWLGPDRGEAAAAGATEIAAVSSEIPSLLAASARRRRWP